MLGQPVRGLSLIVSSGGEDRKFDATRLIATKLKEYLHVRLGYLKCGATHLTFGCLLNDATRTPGAPCTAA